MDIELKYLASFHEQRKNRWTDSMKVANITSEMDKHLLRRYLNGWKEVAKIENEELRRTSQRMKFRQIISIFNLGIGLGVAKKYPTDEQTIKARARWCLLKAGR